MAAPPFTWVESAGATLEEKPRILESQFGDGYVETAPDGLHPIAQSWRVPFRDVDNAIADQIVAFFRARLNVITGLEPFPYTPLWSTTAIMVTCKEWTRTHSEVYGQSDIDATFRQVFVI